jgi:predicted nuclease with TOPRIM domain
VTVAQVPVSIFASTIGALIVAMGAYFATVRRLSGRIETSEADSLWKESASIREDYRDRLSSADQRQARLEERVANLEKRNAELAEENVRLLREQVALQRRHTDMQDELADCRRELDTLKAKQGGRRENDGT